MNEFLQSLRDMFTSASEVSDGGVVADRPTRYAMRSTSRGSREPANQQQQRAPSDDRIRMRPLNLKDESSSSSSSPAIPLRKLDTSLDTVAFPQSLADFFEVRQPDALQESYMVIPSSSDDGRCFFLARRKSTTSDAPPSNSPTTPLLDTVLSVAQGNTLSQFVHAREPFYQPISQLTLPLVAVLEFILFRLEESHALAAVILNSRVAAASLRQQTRLEEMLPAAPPEPEKTRMVASAVLTKRSVVVSSSTTPSSPSGGVDNDDSASDHGAAKTSEAKRKMRREKKKREQRQAKQATASPANASAFSRLPPAKKKLVIQYLSQQNGRQKMQRPLSYQIDNASRWAHTGGSRSSDSDDDDDDASTSSSSSSSTSRSSLSWSSSGGNERGRGTHRMRHAITSMSPLELVEMALVRWKVIFGLNEADELRGWLHLQMSDWFEVNALVGSCFIRTDTFDTCPTLRALHSVSQKRFSDARTLARSQNDAAHTRIHTENSEHGPMDSNSILTLDTNSALFEDT